MSFTMLRGVEPFLAGAVEERLICEQLRALAEGAQALKFVAPTVTARLCRLVEAFSPRL